jgi:soluble P-type ATPase
MKIEKLPKIIPSETIVWVDSEGVLSKYNIISYLFSCKPFLALSSIANGAIETFRVKIQNYEINFIEELIKKCKKYYERNMDSSELYNLGKFIFHNQPENHKKNLIDLFNILKEYSDFYVITSAYKKIVKGFLSCLPEDIQPKEENIYGSEKGKFIGSDEKAAIVESLKKKTNKKIIGIGDSKQDEKALEKSDVRCVISSLMNKLMPIKTGEYKFEDLSSLKNFLSLILFDYELHYFGT